MPFWYIGSLLFLVASVITRLHQPGVILLAGAAGIWVAVSVLSVLVLVPMNKRLAGTVADEFTETARRELRIWDTLHRVRVAGLTLAMLALLAGLRI